MLLLPLLIACSGGPSEADRDTDTGSGKDSATDSDPDTGVDCTSLTCFQACGLEIAVSEPVVADGFSVVCPSDLTTRMVQWHDTEAGAEAITVDGRALIRRDSTLAEIDRIDPLPFPVGVQLAGDLALIPSASGGISVVDLTSALEPVAWWAPGAESGVGLEGVSQRRAILRTANGLAVLDVTEPRAPVELGCAPWTDEAWLVGVSEGFAVAALPDGAHVYDLAGDSPALLGTLPLAEEGGVSLYEDHLLVWEDFRTVVLYALSAGAAPVEIGRREDDTRVQGTLWDPVIAGGLALHGGLDDSVSWAVDLTDPDLALYSTTADDAGAFGCVERYTHADDGSELDLAPIWHPEQRYDPGGITLTCPEGHDMSDPPWGGVREPDGDRMLVHDQGSWQLLDLQTGGEESVTDLVAELGFWLGTTGFGFAGTEGLDWGIPLVSTVTRTDADGIELDVVRSPGPFVSLAALDGAVWVLSEPVDRDYGDPEAPATDRVLWSLRDSGASTSVALPVGAAPLDIVSDDQHLWVFDEAGQIFVYDVAASLSATCVVPDGVGAGARAASPLGVFFFDAAGLPTVVTTDCTVTRLLDAPPAWTLVAADERWLYVTEEWSPGAGFVTVHELIALDPVTLEEAGRLPTWREPKAVGGEPMVVMEQTLLVVARP